MTKSVSGRRAQNRLGILEWGHANWFFGYALLHGRMPRRWQVRDHIALIDIAYTQCAGDPQRTAATIAEILRGPFKSNGLFNRWVELLASGERSATPTELKQLELSVRQNARLAIKSLGGLS